MSKIGFIGVGAMGGAMAIRLMEHGFDILAYDINPQVLAKVVAAGATGAASVREIVDACEIVYSCLPNGKICKEVAFGPGGSVEGSAVKIYVEVSTFGTEVAKELEAGFAERGIAMLDAPVVGGTVALEQRTMGILVSGDKQAFEQAQPTLDAMAKRTFYLGEKAGMSQAAKTMANAVSYAALLGTFEAITLGLKAGIDLETCNAIINQGSGANFYSSVVIPNFIMKGVFSGTGPIEVGQKDVKLFLGEAALMGMETPMASAVSALQKRVVESGEPGRDTMTYFHFFTDLAGLPRQG